MKLHSASSAPSRVRGHSTVADVMTKDVVCVSPMTGYKEVVRLLGHHRISAVPVVEGQRVVGIVSEADLLIKEQGVPIRLVHLLEGGRHRERRLKADGATAGEVMTSPVITVSPDAQLPEAARLMEAHGIKRLPVVDADRLVGICSRADLLKVFLQSDETLLRQVVDDIVVSWMWLDPETVDVHVEEGVVTLGGELERRSDAEILARLTTTLESVVRVNDQLTWRLDDRRALSPGGARFE